VEVLVEVPDDEQPPEALSTPLNAEKAPATSLWNMLSCSLGTRIEKHACALLLRLNMFGGPALDKPTKNKAPRAMPT